MERMESQYVGVDETCIIGVSCSSGFLEFWILFSVQSLVHADSGGSLSHSGFNL